MPHYIDTRPGSVKREEIELFGREDVSAMASVKLQKIESEWLEYKNSIKESETKYLKQISENKEYSYEWLDGMQRLYSYEKTEDSYKRWHKHFNRMIIKNDNEVDENYSQKIQAAREYPIEDLINSDVTRGGSGKQKTFCPFHEEKTPSFYIYDDNSWHCYGCGKHGYNAIDFVMAKGYGFKEALEQLQ